MFQSVVCLVLALIVAGPRAEWGMCIAECGDIAIERAGTCATNVPVPSGDACAVDHCTDCVDLTLSSDYMHHGVHLIDAPIEKATCKALESVSARAAHIVPLPRVVHGPPRLLSPTLRC